MFKGRTEFAGELRKAASDAGSAMVALAVVAVSALLLGLAALFTSLRALRAA